MIRNKKSMGRGLFILILSTGFYLSIAFIGRLSIVSVCEAAQTIDWIQANAQYILINKPTEVTISVQVEADPSLIPTGVNLIQYDSAGKAIAHLGRLYDDTPMEMQ